MAPLWPADKASCSGPLCYESQQIQITLPLMEGPPWREESAFWGKRNLPQKNKARKASPPFTSQTKAVSLVVILGEGVIEINYRVSGENKALAPNPNTPTSHPPPPVHTPPPTHKPTHSPTSHPQPRKVLAFLGAVFDRLLRCLRSWVLGFSGPRRLWH